MSEYHKIQSVYKRDPETKFKTFLEGQFSTPELAYLANCGWAFTEKVDGTNIRVIWDGETLTFGGRTERAQIPAPLVNALNEQWRPLEERLRAEFSDGAIFYGEGYGAKIQKGGGNYRPDQGFVLFDVRIGRWWLEREAVVSIATSLGVDVVPVVGVGTLAEMVDRCRRGFDSRWGDFRAEGIVARPLVELFGRNGHRIITKCKCKDFDG